MEVSGSARANSHSKKRTHRTKKDGDEEGKEWQRGNRGKTRARETNTVVEHTHFWLLKASKSVSKSLTGQYVFNATTHLF